MSRHAQELLRDAAGRVLRASRWLDPKYGSPDKLEDAMELLSTARAIIEGVEITLGVNAAVREESLREGSR